MLGKCSLPPPYRRTQPWSTTMPPVCSATAPIADAAVTTAKIGDAQIDTAKISDAAITTAKIGDLQVDGYKVVGSTVTAEFHVYVDHPTGDINLAVAVPDWGDGRTWIYTNAIVAGGDAVALRTVDAFCALLGGFAGSVALVLGASGGVAVGGGIGAMVVLALASRLTGNPAGVWFGWLLQAAILATGFIEPFMFAVAVVFLALWVFCFVKGGQLDRQNAARRAAMGED